MENNNLNPEDEKQELQPEAQQETGATETANDTAPQEPEAASQEVETPETSEAATVELQPVLMGDSLTVMPVAPVKKKTGMIVGIAAAVIAVCVVAGVAVMGQSPEKAVKAALVKTYAESLKQSDQMIADIPVLAKQNEIAKGNSVTDMTIQLNSMEIPGVPPLVSTLISGSTISGSTKSDAVNKTYHNVYSVNVLGQKLATLDLFTSPEVLSVGVPEFLPNSYYLNMDGIAENGYGSYLFTEVIPTDMEGLQTFADMYKAYITSAGSMNAEALEEMQKRMGEICMENLNGVKYAKVTVDGKKLYTASLPAESIVGIISDMLQYVYLESPLSGQMMAALPGEERTEFINSINTLGADLALELPQTPTVITMDISGGLIRSADILTEGTSLSGSPVRFNMRLDSAKGTFESVTCNFVAGEGSMGVNMDIKATSTYSNKLMDVAVDMNMSDGNSTPILKMNMSYKLDGGLTTNNMDFAMNYVVTAGNGVEMIMVLDGAGDYYLQDNAVILDMGDLTYNITSNYAGESIPIGMNVGMKVAYSALEGQLAQPEGVDALTLNADDMGAIATRSQASLNELVTLFMGKLI